MRSAVCLFVAGDAGRRAHPGARHNQSVRVAYLPDIPTISEHVPGCVSQGWFGFIASRLCLRHRRFPEQGDQRRVSFPDVREKMTLAGLEVVQQPPEYFGDVIRQDYAKYGQLARDIGFKPQ